MPVKNTTFLISLVLLGMWSTAIFGQPSESQSSDSSEIIEFYGMHYNIKPLAQFSPLFSSEHFSSPLVDSSNILFDTLANLAIFKDTMVIDFESRRVSFLKIDTATNIVVWEYHYGELEEYLSDQYAHFRMGLWNSRDEEMKQVELEEEKKKKLQVILPVNYPFWARRILGNEPPSLSIKGHVTFRLGFDKNREQVDGVGEWKKGSFQGFDFGHQFTITGSVGRLISLDIEVQKKLDEEKGSSTFSFDELKRNFKLEYAPDPDSQDQLEDDVIQRIVAGYTDFRMPGQGLAGYSENNEGLMGIKVETRFGPLDLTTIASIQKSEVKKDTFAFNDGGAGSLSGQDSIPDKNYVRGKYFFLHEVYRQNYMKKYSGNGGGTVPKVDNLQLFLFDRYKDDDENDNDFGFFTYNNRNGIVESNQRFRILKEHEDYYFNKEEGWIRLDRDDGGYNSELVLAAILTTDDPTIVLGDNSSSVKVVDALYDSRFYEDLNEQSDLYNLMWRNVYSVGTSGQKNFTLKVIRQLEGQEGEEKRDGKYYSSMLGIASEQGIPYQEDAQIFDFVQGHLIIPPFSYTDGSGQTVYSMRPFDNPLFGEDRNKNIYVDSLDEVDKIVKFKILSSGQQQQQNNQTNRTISLGFGISPGTVNVKAGEEGLKEGIDYRVDYDFGQIELLSLAAKTAPKLIVEYQQQSLFLIDNTTFLGLHSKYNLYGIGKDSYIAATIMGRFSSLQDKMPKIGSEPFNRYFFDANMHLNFEPEWMTRFVNRIPLVSTKSSSGMMFNLEFAHSTVKPDGNLAPYAYIDNFQSSDDSYNFGESMSGWYKASVPESWRRNLNEFIKNPPAWNSFWINATHTDSLKIYEFDLFKSAADDDKKNPLSVLTLFSTPFPDEEASKPLLDSMTNGFDVVKPWTGIMTAVPSSYHDVKNIGYLEFWVKTSGKGKLYVDLGELSDDISVNGNLPNGVINQELPLNFVSDNHVPKYDNGLDTLPNEKEVYYYPNLIKNRLDSLVYGDTLLGRFKNDPNRDDYKEYNENNGFEVSYKVNGFDKSQHHETEDFDEQLSVRQEKYFRFTIDLKKDAFGKDLKFLDVAKINDLKKDKDLWKYFRIPLNSDIPEIEKFNSPQWDKIKMLRLIWHFDEATPTNFKQKFAQQSYIQLMDIKFTGNTWRKTVVTDEKRSPQIRADLISFDPKDHAAKLPKNMELTYDGTGSDKTARPEYVLQLNYKNIAGGQEALVQRNLGGYTKYNLTEYDDLRIYVKGERSRYYWNNGENPHDYIDPLNIVEDDRTNFVIRMGYNDSSYYEYRTADVVVDRHWERNRSLHISITKFLEMKSLYHKQFGSILDSIDISDTLADGSSYRIFSRNATIPSLSDVKWIGLGVMRGDGAIGKASGEIWVHALRVKGLQGKRGWAMKGDFTVNFADLLDFSTNVAYYNGGFRQMSDEALQDKGSTMSSGLSTKLQLDKFLPEKWGVGLSVGGSMSASLTRPIIKPNSDVKLVDSDGEADGIRDMGADFVDQVLGTDISKKDTEAEHYESSTTSKNFYASYNKSATSDNPLVNLTADRIGATYQYQVDSTVNKQGVLSPEEKTQLTTDVGEDHLNYRSSQKHTFALKYNLTPQNPKSWTSYRPFEKSKSDKVPNFVKELQLNLLPSNFTFDLYNGTFTTNRDYDTKKELKDSTYFEVQQTRLYSVTHGMNFSYSPIRDFFTYDYDLSINREFNEYLALDEDMKSSTFLKKRFFKWDPHWKKYLVSFGERSRSQNSTITFDPQFFDWLNNTVRYSSTYSQEPRMYNKDKKYLNTSVNSTFTFDGRFGFKDLFGDIANATKKREKMSNFFDRIRTGLEKVSFHQISFEYTGSLDLTSDYLDPDYVTANQSFRDFFLYKSGLRHRTFRDVITGDINDSTSFGGPKNKAYVGQNPDFNKNDARSTAQSYELKTSIRLPAPLFLNFDNISLKWSRNYRRTYSYDFLDSTVTFPEFNINLNTSFMEQIPIIKKHFDKFELQSGYTYTKSVKRSYMSSTDKGIRSSWSIKYNPSPLISISSRLKKWPVDFTYKCDITADTTFDKIPNDSGEEVLEDGSSRKNLTIDNTWNIAYTLPGKSDRKFKIFKREIKLKGDWDFGLDVNYKTIRDQNDNNVPEQVDNGTTTDSENDKSFEFSFHPKVRYDITDNVEGSFDYEFINKYDKNTTVKKTNNKLAFTITIRFD